MLDPHTMTFAIATLGVGWLMTYAGLSKSALELRQRRRICPSCGKHMRTAVCSSCV
jgi:formate dehydrogenase maturation protein FdhE